MIRIENLWVRYQKMHTKFDAIKNLSLEISEGESLGLVGESGCGKTTLGKCVTGLIPPIKGAAYYNNTPIYNQQHKQNRHLRREIQMIFQDPYSSLNPRMTIEEIITEPLEIYKLGNRKERKAACMKLLSLVGLDISFAFRYPHELSGGQRQRVGIARALAPNPKCLICDEPVAALDVSIQAQIINLLKDLQKELGLTYLFISHDLAIVRHLCHRTAVMYLGEIVEIGLTSEIYNNPKHPYTKALLSSMPSPLQSSENFDPLTILENAELTTQNHLYSCNFAPRCPYSMEVCERTSPDAIDFSETHQANCHLYKRNREKQESPIEKELDTV